MKNFDFVENFIGMTLVLWPVKYLPLSVTFTSYWLTLTMIGSDNGLSPGRRQAIIWTSAGILLIRILGTKLAEILNEIHNFHSRKYVWKYRLEDVGHFVSASMC